MVSPSGPLNIGSFSLKGQIELEQAQALKEVGRIISIAGQIFSILSIVATALVFGGAISISLLILSFFGFIGAWIAYENATNQEERMMTPIPGGVMGVMLVGSPVSTIALRCLWKPLSQSLYTPTAASVIGVVGGALTVIGAIGWLVGTLIEGHADRQIEEIRKSHFGT